MAHQEPSTLEFLMNLSHRLREGDGLAEAIIHAEDGPGAPVPAEQAKLLEERLNQMRQANREGLARLHPDDGA